jgi:hypothetical protein
VRHSAIATVAGSGNRRIIGSVLITAVLILLAAEPREAVSSAGQRPDGAEEAVQYQGFSLTPGTCELGTDFCAVGTPRRWALSEVALVKAALDEIAASDLGGRIMERARGNGFHTLRRFARQARLNAAGVYEPDPLTVAMAHTDEVHSVRTIDVTDRFFERKLARDQFSGEPGYLLAAEILAHELVHAMDLQQQYSRTVEFRRAVRLGMPAALQLEAERISREREPLIAAGQHEADWRASRSFAIVKLRGRLPSMHALENYREAFAEIGAHLVLDDDNARAQFEPRVIQYFNRAVSRPTL